MQKQHMQLRKWKRDHAKYAKILAFLHISKFVVFDTAFALKNEQDCIFLSSDNNAFDNYAFIE